MDTLDLLPELGFTGQPDQLGRMEYELRRGRLKLSAAKRVNRYFREVIIFGGNYATSRSIGYVNFELPVDVASMDHLKAFLSYYLRSECDGSDVEIPMPFWFDEGTSLARLLPWEIERAEYEARPHCYVRKDWMKLVLNDLETLLNSATGHTLVEFRFDNELLEVTVGLNRIVAIADGEPWEAIYAIPASRLTKLPKRLQSGSIEVGVHGNVLRLGNHVYSGVCPKPA